MIPQVIITLSPAGTLQAELPGANGSRRVVPLPRQIGETLLRMLEAQRGNATEIGEDGAPTARQVEHWERHSVWPSEKCAFCQAEGRVLRGGRQRRVEHLAGDGSVKVRRVQAKGKARSSNLQVQASLEELGL